MDKMSRQHRIGSLTFGVTLVLLGILYLIHIFWQTLSLQFIFHLWPCVFILLGTEILVASRSEEHFTYDKAAIILTMIMICFGMGIAGIDFAWEHAITRFCIG